MTTEPHRRELMSLDDWRALGEDAPERYEVQEGVLIVSPQPRRRHQNALAMLIAQLVPQVSDGIQVTPEPDVIVDPRTPVTVRVPDLVLCRGDENDTLTAADVLVAIEILFPGTRGMDLVMKRSEYADAGIPHYWILDADDHRMEVLHLVDGAYVGDWIDSVVTIAEPFDLTIDLDALS